MICTRRMNRLERIDMCTVVPYVCNSSQDVENGSLDLVLSSSTHTKAVQAIVIASEERQNFLQDPLLEDRDGDGGGSRRKGGRADGDGERGKGWRS